MGGGRRRGGLRGGGADPGTITALTNLSVCATLGARLYWKRLACVPSCRFDYCDIKWLADSYVF